MKQSQFVIHNRGLSQILFSTPGSVRSIFKHAFVAAYIALITVVAFHFNAFKNAIEGIGTGNEVSSIIDTSKLQAPQIAGTILLMFLEIRLLRRTLKMLQISNRNMWVFIPFSLVALSLGIFSAVFLPGGMHNKLLLQDDFLDRFKILSVFIYIYMAIPGLTALGSVSNAFNERRISPFITRTNILTSIVMIFGLSCLGCLSFLSQILFLSVNKVDFNYHSPLQLSLVILGTALLFLTIGLYIGTKWDMKRKADYKFFNKNVDQAIALAMIIPLAIGLCSSFLHLHQNGMEYLFIGLVSLISLMCVVYSFVRRTEMGSPRVFMVVVSLLLTAIWMLKFFFEYFGNYNITSMFTLPISLVATSVIMIVIYLKSPMISKLIQFLFAKFSGILGIIVIASGGVSLIPAILALAPIVSESLNLSLITLPILLLAISLLYGYITQGKIKSHIIHKSKKRKILKEVKNA